MARTPILTISQRFGLLHSALVLLVALVCGLGIHYLLGVRDDADKVAEENREAALAADLVGELRVVGSLLELDAPPRPAVAIHAQAARAVLDRMVEAPAHDPSSEEHQSAEDQLADEIAEGLAAALEWAAAPPTAVTQAVGDSVLRALQHARIMAEETFEEAQRANAELMHRSGRALWVLVAAIVILAVFLVVLLSEVRRRVVRPVQRLRDGAERFGRGEWTARVELRQRDELGEMAQSFNRMADRLRDAHAELERRVADRTRQLVEAARLADLGSLAAGVAHEINNPLASIASCAEGLERRFERGDGDREEHLDYLRTIASEAWRAQRMTGQLLALGRYDAGELEACDLADICADLARITGEQFREAGLELVIEGPSPGASVVVRRGEVTQLLMNLLHNARDASPRGGRVWLRAALERGVARFEVEDEGPGIDAELSARVFEPFFTTKPAGQGTGLGLALVAAIVEGYGGDLDLRRGARGGALFAVSLPATHRGAA